MLDYAVHQLHLVSMEYLLFTALLNGGPLIQIIFAIK